MEQLAQLFNAMITSPFLAVTPERELAYLALVSSRAEEDLDLTKNSNGKGNGDASGDVEMNSASQLDSAHSAAVALPGNEAYRERSPSRRGEQDQSSH